MVEEAVDQARLPLPVTIAYLSGVPERSIPRMVAQLEQSGYHMLVVVPLFVCSGSTHLDEIRFMLGLTEAPQVITDVSPIESKMRMIWCSPFDEADQVQRIVEDRLQEMIVDPCSETLLMVGHGSDVPGFREHWDDLLSSIVFRCQQKYGFRASAHATLLPDTIATQADKLARIGRLLVLPLFISEGYFTRKVIPGRLSLLSYAYTGKTYLPHPLITDWIRETVQPFIHIREVK